MILSLEYPIYTAQGNGGGIYVDKNFRLGRVYLKNEQQELLERLLPGLDGEYTEGCFRADSKEISRKHFERTTREKGDVNLWKT